MPLLGGAGSTTGGTGGREAWTCPGLCAGRTTNVGSGDLGALVQVERAESGGPENPADRDPVFPCGWGLSGEERVRPDVANSLDWDLCLPKIQSALWAKEEVSEVREEERVSSCAPPGTF